MDWQALHDGIKSWFAAVSGIPAAQIAWDGEDVGHRELPWVELRLGTHDAELGDELRYIDQGDNLGAEAVGNRSRVLSCRVQSRDQRPAGRAYALLERVRDRLELPFTTNAFDALGVGLQDVAALVDLGPVRDRRQESVGVLDLTLNFASSEIDLEAGVSFIRSVGVGGKVHDGATEITVPEQVTIAPP